MRIRLVLPVLLVGLLASGVAAAAPPSDDPVAEKQRGDSAMDALRFDEALDAYTHAYTLGHDPAVLYNRGRVYQARGEYTRALDDLEAFDRDAPATLKAKVPRLGELIASVRMHVATLTIQCDVDGAHVTVRGDDVGPTPVKPLRVNAGAASVRVEAPDYAPYAIDRTLDGGSAVVLDVHLAKREAIAPAPLVASTATTTTETPKHNRPLTKEWWFWTGVGVVAAGAAVVIIVAATSEKSPDNGKNFSPPRVSAPLTLAW